MAVEARPLKKWDPPSCAKPPSAPEWEEAIPAMAAAFLAIPIYEVITVKMNEHF